MKNANIVFERNTVKFIGFRCIFGRSKSFLVVLWLVFMAFHGFSFLRDGFGIRSGWSRNLCQKCPKIALCDSKSVPNEQRNGHVTLVGSEPKEIQN